MVSAGGRLMLSRFGSFTKKEWRMASEEIATAKPYNALKKLLIVEFILLVCFVLSACNERAASQTKQETGGLATPRSQRSVGHLSTVDYKRLMNQLAEAWNANDARRAVDLFTNDAVYSAPPAGKVRRGRDELLHFFGGPTGRPRPMRMDWHHLVFDEETQIGAGE
jgi:hypothetical protein